MSAGSIALLGALAGLTIFLGLPFGRLRSPMPKVKALLNATAIGILIFLLWDVLDHAWATASVALSRHDYAIAVRDGALLVGCLGVGLVGLVYFDRWVARRARRARMARPEGPGAAVAASRHVGDTRSAAAELSLLIAIGIGLHNFGEGLAIGDSAAAGSILYVVIELLAVARAMAFKEITTWGILLGLALGFITDAIVTAAGA